MTVDGCIRKICMPFFTQLKRRISVICKNIMKYQLRGRRQADEHQEEQCGGFPYDLILYQRFTLKDLYKTNVDEFCNIQPCCK